MLNYLLGVLSGFAMREFWAYLPTIARWQVNRGVKQLPEEKRAETSEKWYATEAKIPGPMSKVVWGILCNRVLAPESLKPETPERIAKAVHFIFFSLYLKLLVLDAFKGKFASPRDLIVRWRFFKMIGDQAITIDDPNAPQPLLMLAEKVQDEKTKQIFLTMVEAMREAKKKAKEAKVSQNA